MAKELNFCTLSQYIDKLNKDMPADIVLDPRSLIDFMMKQPENFSITTRKKTYKCNKIAASVSETIMNLIQKDNTVESFFYDFSDENEEFQIICDYLNFKPIYLTPQNLEIIEKIAKDMKFEMLIKIIKRIKDMNCRYDDIMDKYQSEIDDNSDLFDTLLTKNEEDCSSFIIQSKWLDNEQLQKELLGSIISLVYSSPKLISKMARIISILFEQIKAIQVEKNELKDVNLNLLKKYLMKKISDTIIDSHIGPFIYELIKHNFLQLSKNLNENDDDDSDLLLQCVTNQYITLWILPELDSIVPNLQKFIEKTINNSFNSRPFQKYMNSEYMKDNWKLYKNFVNKNKVTILLHFQLLMMMLINSRN